MIARSSTNTTPHLVLVSIGNTRTALATWSDGVRSDADHIASEPAELLGQHLAEMWERLPATAPRAVVIGSVCPPVLARLRTACEARGIEPLLVVGEDLASPILADVAEPSKVGTDRLCVAAAAFDKLKSACVVADFGTALTVDLVADNNVFLGGTILPGVGLSARALHEHTAQLPLVEVGAPAETLGKDTENAIRNGIFAMMVGALREISERYATQIGKWAPLVLTGGDAEEVAKACDFADWVIPDLCLDGLVLAYRQAVGSEDHDSAN